MASFRDEEQKDAAGKVVRASREWTLQITGPSIDLIREDLDPLFLLNETEKLETRARLAADPALLCHVIYTLCKRQREKLGVDLDEFYSNVIGSGESIQAAAEALDQAFSNFSQPQLREMNDAIRGQEKKIQTLATERIMARLNDPKLEAQVLSTLDEAIDAVLAKGLIGLKSATSSPAGSESAPKD